MVTKILETSLLCECLQNIRGEVVYKVNCCCSLDYLCFAVWKLVKSASALQCLKSYVLSQVYIKIWHELGPAFGQS